MTQILLQKQKCFTNTTGRSGPGSPLASECHWRENRRVCGERTGRRGSCELNLTFFHFFVLFFEAELVGGKRPLEPGVPGALFSPQAKGSGTHRPAVQATAREEQWARGSPVLNPALLSTVTNLSHPGTRLK